MPGLERLNVFGVKLLERHGNSYPRSTVKPFITSSCSVEDGQLSGNLQVHGNRSFQVFNLPSFLKRRVIDLKKYACNFTMTDKYRL